MEEMHIQAGRTTWYKHKQAKGPIIIFVGFAVFLTVVSFFQPGYTFFFFFFIPVALLNILITSFRFYNLGIGEKGIVLKQKLGLKAEQFFAYSDLVSADMKEVAQKGGPSFKLFLRDKSPKLSEFSFQNSFKADLLQLEKALQFRDIAVTQDIANAYEIKNASTIYYLALIPLAIFASIIVYLSIEHSEAQAILRQDYQLSIGTTTGVDDAGHGMYRVLYTYEVNGSTLNASSQEMVRSGNDSELNYYWEKSLPHDKYQNYPVQIENGKYLLLYSKSQPHIDIILFDYPVSGKTFLDEVEVKEEWFERY